MKSTPAFSQNSASLIVRIPQIFNCGDVKFVNGYPCIIDVPISAASTFFGSERRSSDVCIPLSDTMILFGGISFDRVVVVLRSVVNVFRSRLFIPIISTGVCSAFSKSSCVLTSQSESIPRDFANL